MLLSPEKIISVKNHHKRNWDYTILALAIINSLIVPLELSFEPDFTKDSYYNFLDNMVDFLFVVDMFGMAVTSYVDNHGHEIRDHSKIIGKYLKSYRFVFDFLAVLGAGVITTFVPNMKVFKCFKIIRIFRVKSIIAQLNVPDGVKAVINLFKLIFFLFLWIHSIACLWWNVINIHHLDVFEERDGLSAQWFPPLDWVNAWDSELFSDDMTIYKKYFTLLYYAILYIGNNEIGPVNSIEIGMCSLLLILSSLLNTQIFGEIAMLVAVLNRK